MATMRGDFVDLLAVLDWAQMLMDVRSDAVEEDPEDRLFSEASRFRIAKCCLHLMMGFDHANTSHRVAFGLTGAAKVHQVRLFAVYSPVSRSRLVAARLHCVPTVRGVATAAACRNVPQPNSGVCKYCSHSALPRYVFANSSVAKLPRTQDRVECENDFAPATLGPRVCPLGDGETSFCAGDAPGDRRG